MHIELQRVNKRLGANDYHNEDWRLVRFAKMHLVRKCIWEHFGIT